jgi:hypothetical protein
VTALPADPPTGIAHEGDVDAFGVWLCVACCQGSNGGVAMSTITQRFISLQTPALVIDRDFSIVVLFCVLGLLASVFFMTHFPLPVDDATLLTSWL